MLGYVIVFIVALGIGFAVGKQCGRKPGFTEAVDIFADVVDELSGEGR